MHARLDSFSTASVRSSRNVLLGAIDVSPHAEKKEDTEARILVQRNSTLESLGTDQGEEVKRNRNSRGLTPCGHIPEAFKALKARKARILLLKGHQNKHEFSESVYQDFPAASGACFERPLAASCLI